MRRILSLTSWIATGMVGLLWLHNLPFYAGAAWNGFAWRMEHGRLLLTASDWMREQSFWINANLEGLRWSLEGHSVALDDWLLQLPLWLPCALLLALSLRLRRRRGRPQTA